MAQQAETEMNDPRTALMPRMIFVRDLYCAAFLPKGRPVKQGKISRCCYLILDYAWFKGTGMRVFLIVWFYRTPVLKTGR